MLCKDIIKIIEQDYSPRYALSWDNVGLLAGRDDKEVANIYVALDATDEVVDEAILAGADMLVTHHPLIFSGMKQVSMTFLIMLCTRIMMSKVWQIWQQII